MNQPLRLAAWATLSLALCTAAIAVAAAAPPASPDPAAGDACETAVAETIRDMRGKAAQEVQFSAARSLLPQSDVDSTTLAGQGQYRAAAGAPRRFTYTCAVDARSGKASGVVFRESGVTTVAAAERAPVEPELGLLSPEACEAAAAAALTEQYPPIGRIRFESDSRRLQAAAAARTSLEGRGSLERAPGMNAAPFTYRCVFDPANGKIVSVQTED